MTRSDPERGSTYEVQLPEFEGPLDLLLHLVKRHELDILAIPITFITEKYLAYLDLMKALNLDVAGEYLLMAATLAHIKSRELLPRHDEDQLDDGDDEEGDPKEELVRRLLEYQRYRDAAERLSERPLLERKVFLRGVEMEKADRSEAPLAEVGMFELMAALEELVKRRKLDLTYDVIVDRVSISDRINAIVDSLRDRATVQFTDFFALDGAEAQLRHEIVVTFLAVLEMAKLHMIRLLQNTDDGTIFLTRTVDLRTIEAAESEYV